MLIYIYVFLKGGEEEVGTVSYRTAVTTCSEETFILSKFWSNNWFSEV